MGDCVGVALGWRVGETVGARVIAVGVRDGDRVGERVGASVITVMPRSKSCESNFTVLVSCK